MRAISIIVGFSLLIAGVWGMLAFRPNENNHYSGTIEADDVHLGSKIGGRVVQVLVREGDTIHPGDLLVQLDEEAPQARLAMAQAEVQAASQALLELQRGSRDEEIAQAKASWAEAQTHLRMLRNGPRKKEIEAAQQAVEAAKAERDLAAITKKRQAELLAKQNTSQDTMDRAATQLDVAASRLHAAEAQLSLLLAGYREEEIAMAEARAQAAEAHYHLVVTGPRDEQIQQAQARYDGACAAWTQARVDLEETRILSPSEGVVESCRLQPGDLLSPNQTALTMLLYEPLWVRIYIPESGLGQVQLNETLPFSVAAFPGQTFTGRVVQIQRQAEFTPRNVQTPETRDDLVFGVKIEVNDSSNTLRPGMVADFYLNSLPNEERTL
ncbi:MAG: efflux RND transporter periplasmic adaptor subunit [bacterium]|jgi:multidrug resistance efflux pump|nr:efflux RND transporter periplasmic adaptor subunit [bacterium]